MNISVFEHPWLSGLFGDPAMANILSANNQMAHMLAFEAAWSRACGRVGLFDLVKAEEAALAIEDAKIDLNDIAVGMGQDGVPVPRLVAQLRTITGSEAIHIGATSQDVVDTALVMTLRDVSDLISQRLVDVINSLETLDRRFGNKTLMARTRMQAAVEITVHDRIRTWREPLQSHIDRLTALRPKMEKVQIGGAVGNRSALGDHAEVVVADVAEMLNLTTSDGAWHSARDSITEYASFLSLVTGSTGKIGQDIALMAQQDIGEIVLSGGGKSSAMPHKKNPVLAELLVTLARFNATQVSAMHHTMIHEQERSGAAWSLEWMVLPQMAMATGRSLSIAAELSRGIEQLGSE